MFFFFVCLFVLLLFLFGFFVGNISVQFCHFCGKFNGIFLNGASHSLVKMCNHCLTSVFPLTFLNVGLPFAVNYIQWVVGRVPLPCFQCFSDNVDCLFNNCCCLSRKLAKSTLVLIPLFGVHYIVFLGLPRDVDERTELVKLYFEMFFNSIQVCVAKVFFSSIQVCVAKVFFSSIQVCIAKMFFNSIQVCLAKMFFNSIQLCMAKMFFTSIQVC